MQITPHSYNVTICSNRCDSLIYNYTDGMDAFINISNLTSATEYLIEISSLVIRHDDDPGGTITLQSDSTALLVKTGRKVLSFCAVNFGTSVCQNVFHNSIKQKLSIVLLQVGHKVKLSSQTQLQLLITAHLKQAHISWWLSWFLLCIQLANLKASNSDIFISGNLQIKWSFFNQKKKITYI